MSANTPWNWSDKQSWISQTSDTNILNSDIKAEYDDYLQPNQLTKLSNDFKSQTLAQIIQHFTSGLVEEFVMYRLMKIDVVPKIQEGYRVYIISMLERSKRFDENDKTTRDYFFNSWSHHIDSLEWELRSLIDLLKTYFSYPKVPTGEKYDKMIEEILVEARRISDRFFPDPVADVSDLIG